MCQGLFPLGTVVRGNHVEYRKLFGKRVRTIRKRAKLTLEVAAERANLSGNYWGEVERSQKVPSLDTIVAMAKALGVPAHILLKLDREDDAKNLRKRIDAMLDRCSREQLELASRIMHAVIEP